MPHYSVMLEGHEDDQSFLVTIDVSSKDENDAIECAMAYANKKNWLITKVEEVEITNPVSNSEASEVIRSYGRAFFRE